MNNKMAGLVGVLALTPMAAAAAPMVDTNDTQVGSYADLLTPIPNAVEKLKASDALMRSEDAAKLEMAQYYYHHHHHHFFHRRYYHHHHHFFRRFFHHHHHHHYYY